jgi:hypothetical protein
MTTAGLESTDRPGRTFLQRVLDLPTTPSPEPMALTAQVHGFIYSAGAFSTVDAAGARHTFLTRIQNGGLITGACIDALNESHGLK